MIASMTGYGEKRALVGALTMRVEVQTLNSKNLDIHLDVPSALNEHLFHWRQAIGDALQRGRIEVTIDYGLATLGGAKLPDETMIRDCYGYLRGVASSLQTESDLFGLTLHLLGKERGNILPIDEHSLTALQEMVMEAVEACVRSREKEGQNLAKQLEDCLEKLHGFFGEIKTHLPDRIKNIRERLEEKIKTREGDVDANRWEQEVLYYLEKIDIEEECVRFCSHLDYFKATMAEKSTSCGKKLGFIIQEMLRETNTIGSKAQYFVLQHLVVEMKQVLEQMREQVRNVL